MGSESTDRRNRHAGARVLYIAGLGRSGSTLLERAVAQVPGAAGVGELVFLWERGVRNDERCGCGEPFSGCRFWRRVGEVAFGGWDRVDVDRVLRLDRAVNDVRHLGRLLRPHAPAAFRAALHEYLGYYERVYAAVRQVSGCDLVVDSSKLTPLAYALRRSEPVDLRVVHLVRDSRAVAHSWTKRVRRPEIVDREAYMPTYSPSYIAALYMGHHALLELLRPLGTASTRVRYEDFVADPQRTLEQVARFAGLGSPDVGFVRGDELDLGVVHTVAGNPSRFRTGAVRIRCDDAWRQAMAPRQRRTVAALTLPALVGYGYTSAAAPSSAAHVPPSSERTWPSVGVVLATHDRPALMRRALGTILDQDYPGDVHVQVVHDRCEPDHALAELRTAGAGRGTRQVSVATNARTPGLAGARNTAILGLDTDLVAFCDDDDVWLPTKLRAQVGFMDARPGSSFCTTAMSVDYEGRETVRRVGDDQVGLDRLVRSRMAMLHSSSFLVRRDALLTRIGLVDESLPESMAEDWDLLLRAARVAPIAHLDEPLVTVTWGSSSYFADRWHTKNLAHDWLLRRHPEIASDRVGAGHMYGKLAFGHAALGHRREALRMAARSLRARWSEPRAFIAVAVAAGLLSPAWVLQRLNQHGRGI